MPESAGPERGRSLRRTAYVLLAVASLAHMTARVASVHSLHLERQVVSGNGEQPGTEQPGKEQSGKTVTRLVASPLLSANDRSRWSAIRAMVDHQTYAIDQVVLDPHTRRPDPAWYTIDMVRHRGPDGKEHYYSSKPPLLTTLLAGLYALVQRVTGADLETRPFYVVRLMLILVNVLPLAAYFWLLARLLERHGTSDLGRLLVMTAACWGTFLTTFAVTLNNHLVAAVCVLVAVYAALPVWTEGSRSWGRFALAGLFAGFTAANELPAAAFLALLAAGLFWKCPARTLAGFLPAAALVVAAFMGANYHAHQSWRLPYMHRQDGPVVAELPSPRAETIVWRAGPVPPPLRELLSREVVDISDRAVLVETDSRDRWILWDRDGHDRFAVCLEAGAVRIKSWENWYEYAGSYWTQERKTGVDRGEPSRGVYAWHMLLGHHGFFSLTPIWIIGLLGIGLCLGNRDDPLRPLAAAVLLLTVTCMVFYAARELKDRNYGGVTSGFRWLFWLTPLWLLVTLRGADRLADRKWLAALALIALAVSVFSATYGNQNPWTHPWLFDYWSQLGWVDYSS